MKNKLRDLRIAENLTLKQVAGKMNIRFQALSLYEKGECEPDFETLSPVQRGQLRAMADILKSSEKVKKY